MVCERDLGIVNMVFAAWIPGLKRFLDAAGCIMDLGSIHLLFECFL
jgi:hypothetical protein